MTGMVTVGLAQTAGHQKERRDEQRKGIKHGKGRGANRKDGLGLDHAGDIIYHTWLAKLVSSCVPSRGLQTFVFSSAYLKADASPQRFLGVYRASTFNVGADEPVFVRDPLARPSKWHYGCSVMGYHGPRTRMHVGTVYTFGQCMGFKRSTIVEKTDNEAERTCRQGGWRPSL